MYLSSLQRKALATPSVSVSISVGACNGSPLQHSKHQCHTYCQALMQASTLMLIQTLGVARAQRHVPLHVLVTGNRKPKVILLVLIVYYMKYM